MSKKAKTSEVWIDFKEVLVNGKKKAKCLHCSSLFSMTKSGTTSSYKRHLQICLKRKLNLKEAQQQAQLNFPPVDAPPSSIRPLYTGKFDMEVMREAVAHWIMAHEHPFTILEKELFNIMMKHGMLEWQKSA